MNHVHGISDFFQHLQRNEFLNVSENQGAKTVSGLTSLLSCAQMYVSIILTKTKTHNILYAI